MEDLDQIKLFIKRHSSFYEFANLDGHSFDQLKAMQKKIIKESNVFIDVEILNMQLNLN